jgi:hypothetical protein
VEFLAPGGAGNFDNGREMRANKSEGAGTAMKKIVVTAFLLAVGLSLGACQGYENKMPPNSPTGGIGSPTGPATGPASQGVQG